MGRVSSAATAPGPLDGLDPRQRWDRYQRVFFLLLGLADHVTFDALPMPDRLVMVAVAVLFLEFHAEVRSLWR